MEKMAEKAEEWAGKMEWMSRKDGQAEVERGRLVWELLASGGFRAARLPGQATRTARAYGWRKIRPLPLTVEL